MPSHAKDAAKKRPVPTKRSPVVEARQRRRRRPTAAPRMTSGSRRSSFRPASSRRRWRPISRSATRSSASCRTCSRRSRSTTPSCRRSSTIGRSSCRTRRSLSKLEIEMIATVVSAQNRCFYCITAHGNAVRQLGGPVLGEMMVMNYRAARLDKRQRAMLDFAVKLTDATVGDRGGRPRAPAPRRLHRSRHLGHRLGRGLLQHDQPARLRHRHAAEQRLSRAGAIRHHCGRTS